MSANRRVVAAALCLVATAAAQAERCAVTLTTAVAEPVVGERVVVDMTIAYDSGWFAAHAVPLLQRRVDVSFHVTFAPDPVVGAFGFVDAADGGSGSIGVVVGDREVRARRRPEGVTLQAAFTPAVAGDCTLPAPRVRYAYTSRYEETLLGGRQPVDRHEAEVMGEDLVLHVRELPTTGRPVAFCGAIGAFAARAEAPAEVEVGDAFALTMVVTGQGNLATFASPPWPQLDGFAVQGLAEKKAPDGGGGERRFEFDVLALREGAELPPLPFAYFDVRTRGYVVTAATAPLRVVARSPDRPLSERVARLIAGEPPAGGMPVWWWGVIAAVLVVVAIVFTLRKRR